MSSKSLVSRDVRRLFLDYFAARGHEVVASSSLVPANDPTLLFANAGMNQFKEVFTGKASRAIKRATSSQKCVRAGGKHNDLENVGRTARHHTFFEMLGNFSFGDYFKEDAISFAFELLTKEYAIDLQRLVFTVHDSDDEARVLWRKIAGVPDSRVISLGDKDNFWAMGDTGPCGPCSEIHYHQGDDVPCVEEAAGRSCQGAACDCDRWIEIWNLVFMQFEQMPDKTRRPLPRPSVDTGMGLERLCAVLAGVRSNYETDLLRPLIDETARLSGKTFVANDYSAGSQSVSMRAIADHARASSFLIADGVFPEKTGREYVLRRIMRRAIYHGWLLGIRKPFLAGLAGRVVAQMGDVYSELVERRGVINEVIEQEERRFRETLDRGVKLFEDEARDIKQGAVPGDLAFRLYDTYGFPLDLTKVVAEARGLSVDEAGFDAKMDEQRKRGEFAGSGEVAVEAVFQSVADRVGTTNFLGYEGGSSESEIVALIAGGTTVDSVDASAGGSVGVVTAATPFYGEQGGQVGDSGVITTAGARFVVADARKPVSPLTVHFGKLESGTLKVGDKVTLTIDSERRDAIRRNHSATHLLHWALRSVLGEHVTQKGSLVSADRLRFDFSHFAPLSPEDKQKVEDLVNVRVQRNLPAQIEVLPLAEAKSRGAMAFFGEKYGERVRVLSMGESVEFCGGTHVSRTGDIGFFKITEETGIAQGVRRIEAVTGQGAAAYVRRLEGELLSAGDKLRAGIFDVAPRIERLQQELRERDREIEKLRAKLASGGGKDLVSEAMKVGARSVLVADVGVGDPKTLRETIDRLRDKLTPGVIVLAGAEGDKVAMVCAVTGEAKGLHAGKIVGALAETIAGKGGGRPDLGQGGGARPADFAAVLASWKERVAGLVRDAGA
ncbi:MAG TPA: alanine--tRNA ligase [Polyangia bacterium]